jgi:SET domain-containing protein
MTPIKRPRIDERFACFKLEIRKSKIHRYGVYAAQRIPGNRKVIEYTGEKISNAEADRRHEGGGYTYLFELGSRHTIDGAVGGSGAEIINHSCEPNLITRVMKGHILYMSLRPIKRGEELTVDYNFDDNGDKTPCRCGSKKCRGRMERDQSKD